MDINLNLLAKSDGTTIRKHTDDLLLRAKMLLDFSYINEQKYKILAVACEYHDYGKIDCDFQNRVNSNGKIKFDSNTEIPHNIISTYFIPKDKCIDDSYAIVLNAVLNHHFHCDNQALLIENTDKIKSKFECYDNYKAPTRRDINKINKIRNEPLTILVKGLLHKCDYSASANTKIEYPNNFLPTAMEKVENNWSSSGGFNDMQLFCKGNHEQNIIITAPTGMGKTEASLLWLNDSKGFYVLPIRTAINCIYQRIATGILCDDNTNEKVALLHSNNLSVLMEQDHDWDIFDYVKESKQFALPITVCTPDQIFDFVFLYKGYELKLATLSYSKIIIDEIQAYSPDLLAYLIYGLHMIVKMGGKFAIFTATLPPFVKTLLDIKEPEYVFQDFSQKGDTNNRHNIHTIDSEIDVQFIIDKFSEQESKSSNKTLIVCNTVKKAQEIYGTLKEEFGEKVKLLHSKFTRKDRAYLEDCILKDGKTEVEKSVIWVTTQLVEASVDIDFDYLFTELSDLNGLFQRFGRCNRKGKKSTDEYNCYIFTKINSKIFINKDKNTGFIDKKIFDLSKQALENIDGVITESCKTDLLNQYFTYDQMENSDFINEYYYYYKKLENLYNDETTAQNVKEKFRDINTISVIPKSIYSEFEDEILEKQSILKKSFNKCNNRQQFLLEKEEAKLFITNLSVNVYPHEFDRKSHDIIKIEISRFERILVVDCIYDDLGYRKSDSIEDDNTGIFL